MAIHDREQRRTWLLDEGMHRRNYSIRLPVDDRRGRHRQFERNYNPMAGWRSWNKRKLVYACVVCMVAVYVLLALRQRYFTAEKVWPVPFGLGGGQTLVYRAEDLRRVWEWEVAAGHYPSRRGVPGQLDFASLLENPAQPAQSLPAYTKPWEKSTVGIGSRRSYFIREREREHGAPQRPIPGTVADMDIIMSHCDYSAGKYVRDCLRMLREGAGLVGVPRRDRPEDEQYIYVENDNFTYTAPLIPDTSLNNPMDSDTGRKWGQWGRRYEPHIRLPPLPSYRAQRSGCDPDDPRIFHMFWTGKFTDKPYMAILSFLYTQNLGLHLDHGHTESSACRPELWIWVNQGSALATMSASQAELRLWQQLQSNPWTSPFLHPRFQDVVHFKIWNTADQLDGAPDAAPGDDIPHTGAEAPSHSSRGTPVLDIDFGGESDYNRPSVKLSDLVRFVLCHRYGGVYVDMDTVFLRDWEELWNWDGAFAYRWSRLDRYNTAALRLHKGSALGTFLLRTAVRNELDFHPIRITRYLKDAHMENLLMRLPSALFDSAWLNAEEYQRDRPAQPFFERLDDFFMTPSKVAAAPEAMGFDGFFKGAFSYHYHNNWWTPFDPERNFPDLGPVFSMGDEYGVGRTPPERVQDLSWATVLKRTFEAYIRGEQPNMYGEWLRW
ncbi:hypothetical protein NM688_g4964 [Phlebia brevispora]|uniref:Uncharacterized protein n=1 Tax=Phlebia brevispora TaxID=194682 RepID=A0ACC1T158_9APHY|nr:hypothetical protein NM688_g4964 [Phlebia brevispora]